MGTDKRERQKEGHRLRQEEISRWQSRQTLKRRLVRWGGAAVVAVAALVLYSNLSADDEEAATTTTATPTTLVPTECPPNRGVDEPVRTFAGPPPDCLDPDQQYTAIFDTSEGEIRVDLDTGNTPATVNNFVVLARYGYYDGTPIFRTDPSIGIIQGGGEGTDDPGPGYTIPDEGDGYTYEPGQIVMARTADPDSAGAQFFFVADDAASSLDADGSYVVFGTTGDAGLEVVRSILALNEDQPDNPLGGAPSRPVTINSVRIRER
jgi:peptidyl-prolyl cis-trans isomerase B (cyclophilin B)